VLAAALVAGLFAVVGTSTASTSNSPVTLVVLNGDGGETGLLNAYAALNKKFEKAHPGVTIKFEVKSFSDLLATLKLQLSGSSGVPDVTQSNQGYSSLGELVTDGLVKNLNSLAAADRWSARQPASLLALDGQFTNGGVHMGSGPLWGISATGTWVGLYENTAIAKQLGIKSAPTTLTKLEQDMALAKAHGDVALTMGTSDGYEPLWTIYELLMAQHNPQILSSITDGASSKLPAAMTQAATTLESWQKAGYFTPGESGYQNQDAFSKFVAGNGLFVVSGSWSVPIPGPASKTSKFRMILFPLSRPSVLGAVASGDLPWSIPTHSPHPQLAAEYINYITSPAANNAWIAAGQVPASLSNGELRVAASAHVSGASRDALSDWIALLKHGYFEPYMDWATPTFLTTEVQSVQSLLAGRTVPSAFTSALQADYGPFVKSRHG
jgi:raffinose/stachyose/melibiose transport system substrate-binding protein